MPFLHTQETSNEWTKTKLGAESLRLIQNSAMLREAEEWVLIAPAADTILNGSPFVTGIRVLKHRDARRFSAAEAR
jgi:hypothetical protein